MSTQEPASAQPPALDELGASPRAAGASFDTLLEVSVPVIIEIGRARLSVQEVLQLGPGSVVQLDRIVGEPVDIYVSDRKLARGEVVVVGDHFGVRITRVLGTGPEGETT